MLKKVVDAGMKIMRINFSHATYEEANLRANNITLVSSDSGTRDINIFAVMLDTQGPEIRTGSFDKGVKEVELVAGQKVILSVDLHLRMKQTTSKIWISYNQLMQSVDKGTSVLLDDGAIELQVESVDMSNLEVHCKILNSGTLGNKKGIFYGIVEASKNLHASCIICIARKGHTPQLISKYRPNVPIVTFVPDAKLARLLQINCGTHPIISPKGVNLTSTSTLSSHERFDMAVSLAKANGYCKSGDNVIIVATDRASDMISSATTMRVITVL